MRNLPTPTGPHVPVHFVWPVLDGRGLRLVVSCDAGPDDWCRQGSGSCHYLRGVSWTEDATTMTESDYVGFPCVPRIGPIDFTPIGENDCGQPRYAWFYRGLGEIHGCDECRVRGGHSRNLNGNGETPDSWDGGPITGLELLCRCWSGGFCEQCHTDILGWRADSWRALRASGDLECR